MQISVLKKLLQLISPSDSPEEESLPEETSEQSPQESNAEEAVGDGAPTYRSNGADDVCTEAEALKEAVTHTESNRSHLTSSVPRAARAPLGAISKGELAEIRALFKNLDDTEIQRLYKRVTKNN